MDLLNWNSYQALGLPSFPSENIYKTLGEAPVSPFHEKRSFFFVIRIKGFIGSSPLGYLPKSPAIGNQRNIAMNKRWIKFGLKLSNVDGSPIAFDVGTMMLLPYRSERLKKPSLVSALRTDRINFNWGFAHTRSCWSSNALSASRTSCENSLSNSGKAPSSVTKSIGDLKNLLVAAP